jgi:hypothetical protein
MLIFYRPNILFLSILIDNLLSQHATVNKFLFIKKKKELFPFFPEKCKEIFYFLKKKVNTFIFKNIITIFFNGEYKPFYSFLIFEDWTIVLKKEFWSSLMSTEIPLKVWNTNNKFFFLEDYKVFSEEYLQMNSFFQTTPTRLEENPLSLIDDDFGEAKFVGNREVILIFLNSLAFCDEHEENLKLNELEQKENLFLSRMLDLKAGSILRFPLFFSWHTNKNLKRELTNTIFYNWIFDEIFDIIAYDAAKGKNYFDYYFRKNVALEVFANEIFLFSRIDTIYNETEVFTTDHWSSLERRVLERHFWIKKQQDFLMQNSKIWYFSFSVKYNYLSFLKKFHIYLVTLDAILDASYTWDVTITNFESEDGSMWNMPWPTQENIYKLFEEVFFTYKADVSKKRANVWIKKAVNKNVVATKLIFNDEKYKNTLSFDWMDMPQFNDIPVTGFDLQQILYFNIFKERFLQSLKKKNNDLFFGWIEFLLSYDSWRFFIQKNKIVLKTIFRSRDVTKVTTKMTLIHKKRFQKLKKTAFLSKLVTENLLKKSKKRKIKKKRENVNNWFKWVFFQLFQQTEANTKKQQQQQLTIYRKEYDLKVWLQEYKKLPLAVFNIMSTIYLARDQLYTLVKPPHEEHWSRMKKKFSSFSNIIGAKNQFFSKESSFSIINIIDRSNYKKQKKKINKNRINKIKAISIRKFINRKKKNERAAMNHNKFSKFFGKINSTDFIYFKKYNAPLYYRKFFRNFISDNICFRLDPFTTNFFGFLDLFVNQHKFDIQADRFLPDFEELFYYWDLIDNYLDWEEINAARPISLRTSMPTEKEHDLYYNLKDDSLFSENTQNFIHDFPIWKKTKTSTELLYNIQFLKYIRIFFNFFVYKSVFFIREIKQNKNFSFQKDIFFEMVFLQINRIFQHLNFDWFENKIDETLEQGKKFETFYPNHWFLTQTVHYTSPTFNGRANMHYSPESMGGLSQPVNWQIISPLEENIFETELFYEPSFFNFLKKHIYLIENTFFKFINKTFWFFWFIIGFGFIFLVFLSIHLYAHFFNIINNFYQNIILFPFHYCKFFFIPVYDEISNGSIMFFHHFYNSLFSFFSQYEEIIIDPMIKLIWDVDYTWKSVFFNVKDYSLLIDTLTRSYFSIDYYVNWSKFKHLGGILDLQSTAEQFVFHSFDVITETDFYIIQTLFILSVWLIHYNLWYILIGFLLHLLRKLSDVSINLNYNLGVLQKDTIKVKKNNWQFCLHTLFVLTKFINIFLVFFFFSLEIVILKQFIFLTLRWFKDVMNDFENKVDKEDYATLRPWQIKLIDTVLINIQRIFFLIFGNRYVLNFFRWLWNLLPWLRNFVHEIFTVLSQYFIFIWEIFLRLISLLVIIPLHLISSCFNFKINPDFFIIKFIIKCFNLVLYVVHKTISEYLFLPVFFKIKYLQYRKKWHSHINNLDIQVEQNLEYKREHTAKKLLKLRYKRLKWFLNKQQYNLFVKKHRICMWRINVSNLFLLQTKTNFFLNQQKNKQHSKLLKQYLFDYYVEKQKINKQVFFIFQQTNLNFLFKTRKRINNRLLGEKNLKFLEFNFLPVLKIFHKTPSSIIKKKGNVWWTTPLRINTHYFKNFKYIKKYTLYMRHYLRYKKRRYFDFPPTWTIKPFLKKQRRFRKWQKLETYNKEQFATNFIAVAQNPWNLFRDVRQENEFRREKMRNFWKQAYKNFFHVSKTDKNKNFLFFLSQYDFMLYQKTIRKTQRIFNKKKKLKTKYPFFHNSYLKRWYILLYRSKSSLKRVFRRWLANNNKKNTEIRRPVLTYHNDELFRKQMRKFWSKSRNVSSDGKISKRLFNLLTKVKQRGFLSQKQFVKFKIPRKINIFKYQFLQRDWIKKQVLPLKIRSGFDNVFILKLKEKNNEKKDYSLNINNAKKKEKDFFVNRDKVFFRAKDFLLTSKTTVKTVEDCTRIQYYLRYKNQSLMFSRNSIFKKTFPLEYSSIKYFKFTRKHNISVLTIKKQNFETKYFDIF